MTGVGRYEFTFPSLIFCHNREMKTRATTEMKTLAIISNDFPPMTRRSIRSDELKKPLSPPLFLLRDKNSSTDIGDMEQKYDTQVKQITEEAGYESLERLYRDDTGKGKLHPPVHHAITRS